MATLVGRECWVGGAKLFHGTIKEQWATGVRLGDKKGRIQIEAIDKIALDRLSAIRICQDAMEYWHQEREKLEKEIEEGQV